MVDFSAARDLRKLYRDESWVGVHIVPAMACYGLEGRLGGGPRRAHNADIDRAISHVFTSIARIDDRLSDFPTFAIVLDRLLNSQTQKTQQSSSAVRTTCIWEHAVASDDHGRRH
jgi:hypothetical protein